MPLRHFRRQYEQLSQFERRRIIGIKEAGWSARPGSGLLRQTSRQNDSHIARNARVQPNASSVAIQAQVAPLLGALCLLEPYEGTWLKDIWNRCAHYVCCP
ncbi:uncharacterized protein TNCV_664831 [Trichonephila clavipes]|nr:uncharacterized protein TNCV_664831 [Trichonephila clavipes]